MLQILGRFLQIYLFVCVFLCLCFSLFVSQFVYLSVYLFVLLLMYSSSQYVSHSVVPFFPVLSMYFYLPATL